MTYDQYIEATKKNCMKVLADCTSKELESIEYLRKILWEDDKVTGVIGGYCSSMEGNAAENIEGTIFNKEFLKDFNEHDLNMQTIMAYGPEAVDVVIRCLCLKHISILELVEKERESRSAKEKDTRRNSVFRV